MNKIDLNASTNLASTEVVLPDAFQGPAQEGQQPIVDAEPETKLSALDMLSQLESVTPDQSAFKAFLPASKTNSSEQRQPKQVLLDSITRQINESRARDYTGPKWWADADGLTALHVKLNNQRLKLPNGRDSMIIPTEDFNTVMQAIYTAVEEGFFDKQIETIGEKMRAKYNKAARTRGVK